MPIPNKDHWIFGKLDNINFDKEAMKKSSVINMLNRTLQMFRYDNLPETIPKRDLELILQVNGYATFKEVDGNLYAFYAGLGGRPNPYYLPTLAIIANPALNYSKSLEIDSECVVMLNDYMYEGLMPTINKYATLLTEAEISLNMSIINARIPALITADNEATKETAEKFIDKIVNGSTYGIIATDDFFEGIQTHEFQKQPQIKNVIEAIQYIKGSWYNDLGVNAQFNMKREAINEAEAMLNEDILYPLIDTMLECREIGLEKVNKMFGTNIKVSLNSVWEDTREDDKLAEELTKSEIASNENQGKAEEIEKVEVSENESN